jgi:serine/threonine-protein kinase HipA
MIGAATVWLGSTSVGSIETAPTHRLSFAFSEAYRRLEHRPVLGQKFEDDLSKRYTARVPGELPTFFAHVLPEARLRAVLERSLGIEGCSDLELLIAVSKDLPGAVSFVPSDAEAAPVVTKDDAEDASSRGDDLLGFRYSLGGVQMKFSVLKLADRFTVPAHDQAGDWIVKLPLRDYAYMAENEYATLEWARASEFDVPKTTLVAAEAMGSLGSFLPDGMRALALERYDRTSGIRVHQEDFAQVIGAPRRQDRTEIYNFTYEGLGLLIDAICGREAGVEFARRLAFVIATGNNDAHLKNWSLVYHDAITPSLSPMYDQIATIAWAEPDRRLALKLAGKREFGDVSTDRVELFGERANIGRKTALDAVMETLERLRRTWRDGACEPFPPAHRQAMREHWTRVPLLRSIGALEE